MRALRWLMRVLAAGLWNTARAVAVLMALLVAVLAVGMASELTRALIVAVVAFVLLAVLVGILWCLSELARTPPPAVPPGRTLVRLALRVLAPGQIGAALLFAAVTVAEALRHLQGRSVEQHALALLGFGLALGAVGQASLGGILWCAVRVAYPDSPTEGK